MEKNWMVPIVLQNSEVNGLHVHGGPSENAIYSWPQRQFVWKISTTLQKLHSNNIAGKAIRHLMNDTEMQNCNRIHFQEQFWKRGHWDRKHSSLAGYWHESSFHLQNHYHWEIWPWWNTEKPAKDAPKQKAGKYPFSTSPSCQHDWTPEPACLLALHQVVLGIPASNGPQHLQALPAVSPHPRYGSCTSITKLSMDARSSASG